MLSQPEVNLFWFLIEIRIAQIICLNSQNDETNFTYLVDLFCRDRLTLSILQALFGRTNKKIILVVSQ